jgi:hypothetical protein
LIACNHLKKVKHVLQTWLNYTDIRELFWYYSYKRFILVCWVNFDLIYLINLILIFIIFFIYSFFCFLFLIIEDDVWNSIFHLITQNSDISYVFTLKSVCRYWERVLSNCSFTVAIIQKNISYRWYSIILLNNYIFKIKIFTHSLI